MAVLNPYSDLIKNRALNDYTADKVNPPKKWVEPKKVAFCISSISPGQSVAPHPQIGKEAKI